MNSVSKFLVMAIAITLLVGYCFGQELQLPVDPSAKWQLIADGFKFPEGPAWSADGTLYISNCNGNHISRIRAGQTDTLCSSKNPHFSKSNGLACTAQGDLLACEFGNGQILKINPQGDIQILVDGYRGQPLSRPNDLRLLPGGDFYFSDPKSYGADKPDGRLFYYSVAADSIRLVQDSLCFPNGLAISPLDGKLYCSESARNRVLRFNRSVDGTLHFDLVFIELPGGDPDGLEFDIQGNLYVAHFGTGTVFVISSDGTLLQKIPAPGKKPSNLEFGGADRRTLFLTEDETNAVYRIPVHWPGFDSKVQ